MAEIDVLVATIQNGQALSAEVDIGNKTIVGIVTPAGWLAAGLSFQVSVDGGTTWQELLDSTATAISVSSVTGAAAIAMDPTKLRGFNALKVRSGTSGAPVNQTNNPTNVTLLTRLAV